MKHLNKIALLFILLTYALFTQTFAQQDTSDVKKINFAYSTNPPVKTSNKESANNRTIATNKTNKTGKKTDSTDASEVVSTDDENEVKRQSAETENKPEVVITKEVTKKSVKKNLSPTEIYKVGLGDVLFINFQNSIAKYYTVLPDGTIDYPPAGRLVSVQGLTADEIEDLLRGKTKLSEINVKVREYISHKVEIKGLATAGEQFLQFEAMPFFVIKANADVKKEATQVVIERPDEEAKTLKLNDSETDSILIKSGDILTFGKIEKIEPIIAEEEKETEKEYYFAGANICSGGKKEFHNGITLVQAVFDICGSFNNKLKDVVLTRKTKSNKFVSFKYNFKEILDGKITDPILQAGDMIDSEK